MRHFPEKMGSKKMGSSLSMRHFPVQKDRPRLIKVKLLVKHEKLTYKHNRCNLIKISKLDKIKAETSFHEKMFFAALAVIVGLIGWSASNFLNTSAFVLLLALFGTLASAVYGIYQYRFIKQLIKELEDA